MTDTLKELSIQISLGGFSFKINSPHLKLSGELECYDFDSVLSSAYDLPSNIEWSVPNVLIVPFELFDHSCIDHYLLSASMMREGSDRSMFAVRGEYVAVWAVENSLAQYLDTRLPQAEHTHTLLSILNQYNYVRRTIVVDVDNANLMHIAIWGDDGLQTAISTQIDCDQDVLYFCRRLSKTDEMIDYKVICLDRVEQSVCELLAQYYHNITVR